MKIKNIRINSYGNLKEKEINLENNLNIIYGKNESGKSTLLNYIKNIFYGISKNKNGKEISDYEKYTPWIGEEFSGKINYELDNGNDFEVYRDFHKKSAQVVNENLEDVSNQYKIDKKDGNQFFYDQTGLDEKTYLSTIMSVQQEVVLDKTSQNGLVQKMANLAGTGEDKVSFQKAMDKLNKRLVEEVGTSRSQDRPLNVVQKRMKDIETVLKTEEEHQRNKQDLIEGKNEILKKLEEEKTKNDIFKQLNIIMQKNQIAIEKNKLKIKLKNEDQEKVEKLKKEKDKLLKSDQQNYKEDTQKIEEQKTIKNNDTKNKLDKKIKRNNWIYEIVFVLLIIINVFNFLWIPNKIVNYSLLTLIPIEFILFILSYRKNSKLKNKMEKELLEKELQEKQNKEKIEEEISTINTQIKLLENEVQKQIQEISEEEENINENVNTAIMELKRKNVNFDFSIFYMELPEIEYIQNEVEKSNEKMVNYQLQLNRIEFEEKNVSNKLEETISLKEEYENLKEQLQIIEEKNKCIQVAKELLEKAYEKMKKNVTPKFTQNLSNLIKQITNGKYKKVTIHEEKGLIVELENGEYIPASLLSVGTIDQLYLSLRLAMLDEISKEKMPIILDETFAYFDDERLKNSLLFLIEQAKEHQILLFTCTKREKQVLDEIGISYHWVEI